MKWFEGSINEAIIASKAKKAIFVVFVDGNNEDSVKVSQTIESSEISSRLEQEDFVAVRIEYGSETHRFFTQIYPLAPSSSIFFIGETGDPLAVVVHSGISIPTLAAKIDDILTKAGKISPGSRLHFIESEPKADVSGTSSKDNNIPNEQKSDEIATELSHEEKVTQAQRLMELQKKQRIEEEMRKKKEREQERELHELRLKQREQEIKQSQEERLKEKAADSAAKERVRQQIAQDRLLQKERVQARQKDASQQQQQPEQKVKTSCASSSNISVARIQFRLPSGSTHMGQFEPSVTLGALRDYVVRNIELPFQHFAMSTSFPRRDLPSEDDSKTLMDLELVPTSVILILPLKNANSKSVITSSDEMGFLSRIIWSVFTPIIGVYNYVMRYFFNSNTSPDRQQADTSETNESTNTSSDNVSRNIPSNQQSSGIYRRNLVNDGTKVIRGQGNVHRLHSLRDDNDENNTWNGNSTQQM